VLEQRADGHPRSTVLSELAQRSTQNTGEFYVMICSAGHCNTTVFAVIIIIIVID